VVRAELPDSQGADCFDGLAMPSLIRLLVVLGFLGGFAYAAIFALATLVEPKPREITITIPQDRLAKPR
jgi:hypothetical protein